MKWTSKCVVLTCSRLASTSLFNYSIGDHLLHCVIQYPYLGILFDSKLSFFPHITNITSKATRTLNFVKRNLCKCSFETKCVGYTSIVRSLLEYGSAVWDPYLQKDIYSTAQMQRHSRSHHFASGEYTRVMFDAQVTLCYSRALEMTNSRVIFPRDNRSSRSRRAKVRVWTLERASETQPTRELVHDCSIRVFRSWASKHWPSQF